MLVYHQSVTGSWKTSPYQLYTDIYTPRHVYGFNNVLRGEQLVGPKVIEAYDRWGEKPHPGTGCDERARIAGLRVGCGPLIWSPL